jgi:hypothetical protein
VEYINTIADTEGLDLQAKLVNAVEHDFYKIHNKGLIADDGVLISSINWNLNSVTENRETGLIIHDSDIANYFADVFDYDWCDDLTPPVAAFSLNGTCLVNTTVVFDASDSSDNVGIVNNTWFMDGKYASDQAIWETNFSEPGSHEVELVVRDAWNNTDTLVRSFSVILPTSMPPIDDNGEQYNDTGPASDDTSFILIGVLLLVPIFVVVVVLYIARIRTR